MEAPDALEELRLIFVVVRVRHAAVDGTDLRALLDAVESHTLGAERGIDDENLISLANRIVRTFRLANAAVDALFCNHRGHGGTSFSDLAFAKFASVRQPDPHHLAGALSAHEQLSFAGPPEGGLARASRSVSCTKTV
jgi:hypothetical protein